MGMIKRKVKQFTLDGELIEIHEKMEIASKKTGTNYGSIANCCRGKIKTANGFVWKYDNSDLKPKRDPLDDFLTFL